MDPHGDQEFSIRYVPRFDLNGSGAFTFYEGVDGAGKHYSFKFVPALWSDGISFDNRVGSYVLIAADTVVFSGSTSPIDAVVETVLSFANGYESTLVSWVKPWLASQSGVFPDTAGVRNEVLGVQNEGSFQLGGTQYNYTWGPASGPPLSPIVQMSIGSNLDGTSKMNADFNLVQSMRTGFTYRSTTSPQGVVFGTSLEKGYVQTAPSPASQRVSPGYRTAPKILTYARSGSKATDMSNLLAGLPPPKIVPPLWAFDDEAINEVQAGLSASTILANKAALMASVRAAWPGVVYGMVLPGPCAANLSTAQKAVWQALNAAPGGGGICDLGADFYVWEHIATIGDNASWVRGGACPNMLQAYMAAVVTAPAGPVYDGIHWSSAARAIQDQFLVSKLTTAGVWRG
jgi:hypothetical protein